MAEAALAMPMKPGSTCDPRWRARLNGILALDERSLPSSDDEPMADSDAQLWPLTYSVDAIAARFSDRDDVYVSGDIFVYYVARNIAGMPVRGQIAPDVLAVRGVEGSRTGLLRGLAGGEGPGFCHGDLLEPVVAARPHQETRDLRGLGSQRVLHLRSPRELSTAAAHGTASRRWRVPGNRLRVDAERRAGPCQHDVESIRARR